MQDNSTTEMLIKYMDGELNEAEKESTEKLLHDDASLQERYQYLLAAKRAIKSQGLKQRVQAIHQEYIQEVNNSIKSSPQAIKHSSSFKIFMRIAAVFMVAIVGYVV